jgi:hypothetical protein
MGNEKASRKCQIYIHSLQVLETHMLGTGPWRWELQEPRSPVISHKIPLQLAIVFVAVSQPPSYNILH